MEVMEEEVVVVVMMVVVVVVVWKEWDQETITDTRQAD